MRSGAEREKETRCPANSPQLSSLLPSLEGNLSWGCYTSVSWASELCAHGLALTGVREVGVSLMHLFLKISSDLNSSWPIFHMQRRKSLTLKENSQTDVENGFILLWLNCSGGCCIYYYIRNHDKVMFSVCVCVCDVLCVCVCV